MARTIAPAALEGLDRRAVAAMCTGAALLSGCGHSNKPLRIIVPLSPGATGDIVARKLMNGLSHALNRQVYVDNLPGAGGIIGTDRLAKAPRDGGTIGFVSSNYVDNPGIYRRLPYDMRTDITPIAIIGDSPQVLLASPNLPANNLQDLIALAKAKPGALHYGSSGIGTTVHLMGVMLANAADIDIVHVPYKGGAPMMAALLGGQVDFGFQATTVAAPYVRAGKLRPIGIASKAGSRLLPNVPAIAQQGLPDYDLSIWMAVLGPGGLAADVVQRLNGAVNQALLAPETKQWFDANDWRLTPIDATAAAAFVQAEETKHLRLIKDAGIAPT